MANRGGQPGNKNGSKSKLWLDALLRTAVQDPTRLRKIAEKVFTMAEGGDMRAVQEIGDRLDGKPMQQMEVSTPTMTDAYRELPDAELLAIATRAAQRDGETLQ